jgi:hypothetical protein
MIHHRGLFRSSFRALSTKYEKLPYCFRLVCPSVRNTQHTNCYETQHCRVPFVDKKKPSLVKIRQKNGHLTWSLVFFCEHMKKSRAKHVSNKTLCPIHCFCYLRGLRHYQTNESEQWTVSVLSTRNFRQWAYHTSCVAQFTAYSTPKTSFQY